MEVEAPRPHGCRVCDASFETWLELLFHERHDHDEVARGTTH